MSQTNPKKEPVVIVGGFLSEAVMYRGWQQTLQAAPYNRPTYVAGIRFFNWLTTQDDTFRPQLQAVREAVARARRETGAEKVWLLAHSAGGRVARLWLGDKPYAGFECGGHKFTRGLICLGSPYQTQEPWAKRSTRFANTHYPGAFYPDLKYVSVIGKAVYGRANGTIEERIAYRNYRTQAPTGEVGWGDGVIRVEGALIPGADNLVLDGIYHGSLPNRPGYFSPRALPLWSKVLI